MYDTYLHCHAEKFVGHIWTVTPELLRAIHDSMSVQSTHLQAAMAEYQKIQTELSNTVDARSRLGAQLSENELVKKAGVHRLHRIGEGC
jgi:hypothetical protein